MTDLGVPDDMEGFPFHTHIAQGFQSFNQGQILGNVAAGIPAAQIPSVSARNDTVAPPGNPAVTHETGAMRGAILFGNAHEETVKVQCECHAFLAERKPAMENSIAGREEEGSL
jgi:hypothetical protein